MKKLAIAASSVALAAMPVMGVFAATGDVTEVTDTINVTVEDSCTFKAEQGGALNSTYSDDEVAVGTQATLTNGGLHTFNVFCNDDGGWTVSAAAPGVLHDSEQSDTAHDFVYQNTAITAAGVEGKWSAAVAGAGALSNVNYIPVNGGAIAGKADETPATGVNFTVTYDVWTGTQSAAGNYSGQVVYTLTSPQTNG